MQSAPDGRLASATADLPVALSLKDHWNNHEERKYKTGNVKKERRVICKKH